MITSKHYHKNRHEDIYECRSRNCLIMPAWEDYLCLNPLEA
jgi:hypothetical protein